MSDFRGFDEAGRFEAIQQGIVISMTITAGCIS
jgi:hypothetical protein